MAVVQAMIALLQGVPFTRATCRRQTLRNYAEPITRKPGTTCALSFGMSTKDITTAQDKKNSDKIELIRRKAGGEMHRCGTCTHSVDAPFRRIADGKVVEGCVDAAHTASMQLGNGASQAWHNRQAARKIRASALQWALSH